jgi:hypothetical protein
MAKSGSRAVISVCLVGQHMCTPYLSSCCLASQSNSDATACLGACEGLPALLRQPKVLFSTVDRLSVVSC